MKVIKDGSRCPQSLITEGLCPWQPQRGGSSGWFGVSVKDNESGSSGCIPQLPFDYAQ